MVFNLQNPMKLKRRWKWRLKKVFLWVFILFIFIFKYFWPFSINLKDPLVLDIPKCPACFGENLCPQFLKGNIVLTNWTRITLLSKMFNAKNTYFGRYHEVPVILKKLAHNHELDSLDKKLCKILEKNGGCENVGTNIRMIANLWMSPVPNSNLDYHKVKSNTPEEIETFQCVKSQEMVDFLMKRTLTYHIKHEHFLFMAFINPEPLIAMAFPAAENWPFPEYYGACGRFSVFEDVGKSLNNYISSSWSKRARLALQVLQMALKFTFNDPIGLYLTDWNLDNFAVSENLHVKLIDLENIILVNRTMIKITKAPGWNVDHHSVAFGCEKEDCFSYSVEDICSHYVSDHNVFGACFGVIKPLLQKYVPDEIRATHPLLERLINECTWPSNPGGRLEAAKQLIDILKQI